MSNSGIKASDDEQVEQLSQMFKAISNPNRLKILLELTQCPESGGKFIASVEEMKNCQRVFAEELGLAPSTVSHHFKELRQAGLIEMKREGKDIIVQVNRESIDSIKNLF